MKNMNLSKLQFRGSRGLVLLWMLCCVFFANAQVNILGKVIDSNNVELTGVSVLVKGTNTGTITDINGNFSISAPSQKSILVFSFIGYTKQEITVGANKQLTIKLLENTEQLEEVIVVGYGTQKKVSVTGSISQLTGKELLKIPVASISQMLGGRVNGVISRQSSGTPGSDAAALTIRGGSPLVIVDGIERDINQLDPNEIENISILKDASSIAVYGFRAAGGVILVTTKKGKESKSKITYSAEYAMNENTSFPTFMNGPQYAFYWNKALEMDGKEPVFTKEMVDKMINGDPEGVYGNTNWVDQIFRTGNTQHHNISASGGTQDIKYYIMVGYYNQKGNVKNFDFSRYNVRTNIDAKVAKGLTANLNIAGRKEDRNQPYFGAGKNDYMSIIQQAIRAHPYVPMTYNGLPTATKTASAQVNPIAGRDLSGFNDRGTSVFQSNFTLNWEIPGVTGLSAKVMVSYDQNISHSKVFKTPYLVSLASRPTSTSPNLTYLTMNPVAIGNEATASEGLTESSRLAFQGYLNYDRTFGKHKVGGQAIWEQQNYSARAFGVSVRGYNFYDFSELDHAQSIGSQAKPFSGSSYQIPHEGFIFRGNYAYDQKYLFEFSGRYDGSYKFSPETRWLLFPSASLGWRVSEENFFKEALPFVTNLKLRVSAGQLGDDSNSPAYGYLRYMSFVSDNPSVVIGNTAKKALMTSSVPNTNTWEVKTMYNGGFDLDMWNGLFGLNFDWFYNLRTGILNSQSGVWPGSVGGNYISVINYGKVDYRGFEMEMSHKNRINDFTYGAKVRLTWTKSKILRLNESENIPDYQKQVGLSEGMKDGFVSLGLFRTDEEAATYPTVREGAQAGDIRYKDLNGDGKITYDQDRAFVGKSNVPELMGGVELEAAWKGFDISALFTGAAICDVALMGWYDGIGWDNTEFTRTFYHDGNSPLNLVQNSWTYDNPTAKYPRLSTVSRPNNGWASTFWFVDGSYIRLKSVQIGYTIPKKIIKVVGLDNVRFIFSGSNLFTLANERLNGLDPEAPDVSNGYYPQQKTYSVGMNVTF